MVADRWQRRGVGITLVAELLSRCVSLGVRNVVAVIQKNNAPAWSLARSTTLQHRLSSRWTTRTFARGDLRYLAITYSDEPAGR